MIKFRGELALVCALALAGCKSTIDAGGCSKDADCKGDRVCVSGECTDPARAQSAPGPHADIVDRANQAARGGPQLVVDEEIAVSASSWQMRGFSLASPRRVLVSAEGVKHADKGFMVYVIASDQADNFRQHQQFRHLAEFQGLKVRSFSHTDTVPAGSWYVVVQNSENILNTMVVHLKVVTDAN